VRTREGEEERLVPEGESWDSVGNVGDRRRVDPISMVGDVGLQRRFEDRRHLVEGREEVEREEVSSRASRRRSEDVRGTNEGRSAMRPSLAR